MYIRSIYDDNQGTGTYGMQPFGQRQRIFIFFAAVDGLWFPFFGNVSQPILFALNKRLSQNGVNFGNFILFFHFEIDIVCVCLPNGEHVGEPYGRVKGRVGVGIIQNDDIEE